MIVVLFNAHCNPVTVALPGDDWVVVVDQQRAGTEALTSHHSAQVAVPPLSALVLVDRASFEQSTGC